VSTLAGPARIETIRWNPPYPQNQRSTVGLSPLNFIQTFAELIAQ
jgi:hypothetical protein